MTGCPEFGAAAELSVLRTMVAQLEAERDRGEFHPWKAALEATVQKLGEERDREDRLLRAHWIPSIRKSNSHGEQWRWTQGKNYGADWVEHSDRAEAARLAEQKMEGK